MLSHPVKTPDLAASLPIRILLEPLDIAHPAQEPTMKLRLPVTAHLWAASSPKITYSNHW